MSKPIKEMIVAHYRKQFEGVKDALMIDIRGIEANTNNELRIDLLQHDIHITVLKNSFAKKRLREQIWKSCQRLLRVRPHLFVVETRLSISPGHLSIGRRR